MPRSIKLSLSTSSSHYAHYPCRQQMTSQTPVLLKNYTTFSRTPNPPPTHFLVCLKIFGCAAIPIKQRFEIQRTNHSEHLNKMEKKKTTHTACDATERGRSSGSLWANHSDLWQCFCTWAKVPANIQTKRNGNRSIYLHFRHKAVT